MKTVLNKLRVHETFQSKIFAADIAVAQYFEPHLQTLQLVLSTVKWEGNFETQLRYIFFKHRTEQRYCSFKHKTQLG